jgi:hypothetical protein
MPELKGYKVYGALAPNGQKNEFTSKCGFERVAG